MYKIVSKKELTNNIFLMDIEAPRVAKSAKPGQFVIVKNDEKGERVPLTIADYDEEKGTVTIVFQAIGKSTKELASFEVGYEVADFVGPLGQPSELIKEKIEDLKKKKIVFIAGGVGAAPVYPQVKWLHEQGVEADVILGSRSKSLMIFEEELKKVAGNLYVATDDGTYGFKGTGSDLLKDLVNNQGKKYDHAVIIGPMIMMKFTSMLTKELGIPTTVSLNPIMVDGTGMCGACRVTVGGQVKFACVDGPEFDGHLVNYDEAMRRQNMYKTEEGRKELKRIEGDTHHGGCGQCHEEE
ncbi:MAG: sulfide/dihydroorotate dehydrogenase-like FAD/NAD-binding protein [Clostridiales bacterium]|uniref:sulfide/dihydroorotate dehydrogenase-like FAD/NAD-binding protein n=1 Tax=Clostridium sp. N3C TaxID=1776758 RepID=UPI00092DEEF1|nr:sulfide/dihydroorotate dehydrogenase-like FAD/NAD-binding protein [Clostridium sp. N3C]NLZ47790.1 sulfide/dihydroorotate dehydrogenase-like FAD/NAD-binding protein [Clostridiales bacterium]SCN24914.1 Dihydroorotate oxidase B, electron transfer subunit [Clostridium sp. N3C]